MTVMDKVNTNIIYLAQQIPGQNLTPQAPGDFGAKVDRALNFGVFIGLVVAVAGVLAIGASLVISRREGSSEEATASALRVGIGCLIIGSAGSIVAALI
ncbi:hypothetical protein [Corynebacterium sanguinis]|uniref:Uncharacterized protein n=1 Tax=Corynebacterium sanguinis TaxID=2594913 RepID=A0A6C1TV75_9CORY|nr:hypothetical protein [Corynebacterium sanguinis]TVS26969.1 hypothetical protein EKI59_09730 [Corynebacterium sanguinis]